MPSWCPWIIVTRERRWLWAEVLTSFAFMCLYVSLWIKSQQTKWKRHSEKSAQLTEVRSLSCPTCCTGSCCPALFTFCFMSLNDGSLLVGPDGNFIDICFVFGYCGQDALYKSIPSKTSAQFLSSKYSWTSHWIAMSCTVRLQSEAEVIQQEWNCKTQVVLPGCINNL